MSGIWDDLIGSGEEPGPSPTLELERRKLVERDRRARPLTARELMFQSAPPEADRLSPEERAALDAERAAELAEDDEP